jgi:hypothetical protein
MIIARWHIDARFGHKQAVIESLKKWLRTIGAQIGWTENKVRIATGSVGALESTVEVDVTINDLAELNASWEKLGTIAAHKEWSKEIEPYIVSGTPRWDVFRIVDWNSRGQREGWQARGLRDCAQVFQYDSSIDKSDRMARPLRLEFPCAIYHLTGRGTHGRRSFLATLTAGYFSTLSPE